LFSFISKNWQGVPLINRAIMVALMGSAKTDKGFAVTCVLDEETYESGIKVSDDVLNSVNIVRDGFHGEWNYRVFHKFEKLFINNPLVCVNTTVWFSNSP